MFTVYCPSSVNITPSVGSPFKVGDVLTCVSDGYPEPSYTWTDSNGVVVSTASTITLSEGPFSLTCTATGNLTTPCNASSSVSGNANGKIAPLVTYSSASISSLYHVEFALLSSLSIVMIVFVCACVCPPGYSGTIRLISTNFCGCCL